MSTFPEAVMSHQDNHSPQAADAPWVGALCIRTAGEAAGAALRKPDHEAVISFPQGCTGPVWVAGAGSRDPAAATRQRAGEVDLRGERAHAPRACRLPAC